MLKEAPAKPQRSSLRSEQRELTRSRLCKAARALFEEKGFGDTSIDDIAAHAQVARATVYLHYQGKEAILADLLQEDLDTQLNHFEWLAAAKDANAATLRKWIARLVRAHQMRRKSIALYGYILNKEPEAGAGHKIHREKLIAVLAKRFPSFDAARENHRINLAAHSLLLQLDHFCTVIGQGHVEQVECAVDLMTDTFGEFLFRTTPPVLAPNVCFPTH
jgi:AcrR family transcriptional regulator